MFYSVIGRYLQMMRLLKPIAGEVMHCLCQVFDYYLYSVSGKRLFNNKKMFFYSLNGWQQLGTVFRTKAIALADAQYD